MAYLTAEGRAWKWNSGTQGGHHDACDTSLDPVLQGKEVGKQPWWSRAYQTCILDVQYIGGPLKHSLRSGAQPGLGSVPRLHFRELRLSERVCLSWETV